jgi:uncharacterized membrane protein
MGLQIVLRLIHVVGGVFWVGAMLFNAAFLFPAMRDAGPDGARVAAGIMRRRFAEITPVIALATMISGLWLYSRASVGFRAAYMRSPTGIIYAVGGLAAISAFLFGVIVVRPAMVRASALSTRIPQMEPAERDAALAQAQMLRKRAGGGGNVVAVLLFIAAAAMAVGRYA